MAAVVDENDDESEVMETPVVWGRQDISSLKGNNLYWATVIEEAGCKKNTGAKQCLFCGLTFTGGPFQIRAHLGTKAHLWARLSVVYRRLPVCASGGVLFLLRGLPWEIEMVVGKLPKMLGKLASWQPFSLSFRWGGCGVVTCVLVYV